MTKTDFLKNLKSPLPNTVLKKFPEGNITQLWGENPELYSEYFKQKDDVHRFTAGHSGIDIKDLFRTPIYAAHEGKIEGLELGRTGTGGIMVFVWSPFLEDGTKLVKIVSGYAHLDECVVKLGDIVTQGQLLGYMGNTGFVISGETPYWGNAPAGAGVHLHFMMYENRFENGTFVSTPSPMGNTFDPLPWLTEDWSGTKILLNNVTKLLIYWLQKYQK